MKYQIVIPEDGGANIVDKKKHTVAKQLRILLFSSVALVAVAGTLVATIVCVKQIQVDYKTEAEIATAHLLKTFDKCGEWKYDEASGRVFCGDFELTADYFNSIQENNSAVFHTIFVGDTRKVTNIKGTDGNYVLGTTADAKIYEAVKSGKTYTKNSVKIINGKYTVCYMPLYNNNEFFGMLFTGINQKAVNKATLNIVVNILIWILVIIVIMVIITQKALKKVSVDLSDRLNNGYDKLEIFTEDIKDISDRTKKEAEEISTAMENVATGAVEQADATQKAMASTEEFSANIDVVDNEINDSYNFIETIRNCVDDSETSVNELRKNIDSNNGVVKEISEDIRQGVESTKRANTIVQAIDDIALQINLLALNASVEASHAGIYGRGFAVVADEIKKLATESANSVSETSEIIEDIVETMNKTNKANELLIRSNKEQMEKSEEVGAKMEALKGNIEEIARKLDNIKDKSNTLGIVKEELVQIVTKLSSASQENAAVSEEVSASTETVTQDVEDLDQSLKNIEEICDIIKGTVEYFG